MKYFRLMALIFLMLSLMGCASHGKKGFFGKESDTLITSTCESCQEAPFYVNGRWLP